MSTYPYKNRLALATVPFVALVTLAACTPPQSSSPTATEHSIRVSGSGTTYATPDVLSFTLVITREGETVAPLKDEVDKVTEQVLDTLADVKIDPTDIRSYSVQAQPVYDYSDNGSKPRIRGFSVSRSIDVTMRDPDQYDRVLDEALRAGITTIQAANYRVSNPSDYYSEALRRAIADARNKAQVLANSSGVELGYVIRISEHSSAPQPVFRMEQMRAASSDVSLPGQSDIEARVEVEFSIE